MPNLPPPFTSSLARFKTELTQGADTGAISTTVDPSVAAAYWGQVDGAEDTAGDGSGWEYPCGATLPDFNLYMDGQVVTLAGGLLAWADAGQGES